MSCAMPCPSSIIHRSSLDLLITSILAHHLAALIINLLASLQPTIHHHIHRRARRIAFVHHVRVAETHERGSFDDGERAGTAIVCVPRVRDGAAETGEEETGARDGGGSAERERKSEGGKG